MSATPRQVETLSAVVQAALEDQGKLERDQINYVLAALNTFDEAKAALREV